MFLGVKRASFGKSETTFKHLPYVVDFVAVGRQSAAASVMSEQSHEVRTVAGSTPPDLSAGVPTFHEDWYSEQQLKQLVSLTCPPGLSQFL